MTCREREPAVLVALLLLHVLACLLQADAAEASDKSLGTLTNSIQLAQIANLSPRAQWAADLEGTVLAGGSKLALVNFEEMRQIRIIDARHCEAPLKEGQRIRYRGQWFQGEGSDRPDLWATVNNDGSHSMVSANGHAVLKAGRHPLRLLYFDSGGSLGLEVYYQGPGIPLQRVPVNALWHQSTAGSCTNWMPGLAYRYFEGDWPGTSSTLNNFASREPVANGNVLNFDLSPAKATNRFGLEFSGFIEVPRTGLYEFSTMSDDGSLLFIDSEPPEISVLGMADSIALPEWAAGQGWDTSMSLAGGAVSGRVSFVHRVEDGLEFELISDQGRTFARLLNPGALTPELLNGCRVRATGVIQNSRTPEGLEILGRMLIPSAEAVGILNLPHGVWLTMPQATVSELKAHSKNDPVTLRRLSGELGQRQSGGTWQFADETGVLSVALDGLVGAAEDQPAELLLAKTSIGDSPWRALSWRRLAPAKDPKDGLLPVLTSIEDVKKLTRAEAQRGYPVEAAGVLTLVWPDSGFFFQDDTWSIDVRTTNPPDQPHIGDFWQVKGYTFAQFAPNIEARFARRISAGVLPAPVSPTLSQLMDGSLDTKYVEIKGVVSTIEGNHAILLTSEGRVRIHLPGLERDMLERSLDGFVRIRGCVVPGREAATQRVLVGEVGLINASLTLIRPAPRDHFSAPLKTVPELLLFDAQAVTPQRVKVRGQILHQRRQEFYFMDGTYGARFIPKTNLPLQSGDMVEIVGFPDLKGPSPLLRDATVRKTGEQNLPHPVMLGSDPLISSSYDSIFVAMQGQLLAQRRDQQEQILELQAGTRLVLARLQNHSGSLPELQTGSTLELRGVYVGMGGDRVTGREIDRFELLVNSPDDLQVIKNPPWWTMSRALTALAILGIVLVLAMTTILALRRRVAQRTLALTEEIEDHKRTERQLELKTQMLQKEIEERMRMEQETEKGHKQLLATSRLAGMAEVATSVLHNVGNAMTSVNVLSSAILKQLYDSKTSSVRRLGDLLQSKQDEFEKFVVEDQRGRLLPAYVSDLGTHLEQEQSILLDKVNALRENIHHIHEIVQLQQDYASVTGMLENVAPLELMENALRMHGESMKRHRIEVIRDFQPLPPVTIDPHKTLQILFNLLENAKHACLQTSDRELKVTVTVQPAGPDLFEMKVADNGMGISAENLPRIFDQGFSTRSGGHGFGLHSSILMAQDMGGTMTVFSAGPDQGATFTLRLPTTPTRPNQPKQNSTISQSRNDLNT